MFGERLKIANKAGSEPKGPPAVGASAMTADTLTAETIAALPATEIPKIDPGVLQKMTPEQLGSFTEEQLKAMTPAQRRALVLSREAAHIGQSFEPGASPQTPPTDDLGAAYRALTRGESGQNYRRRRDATNARTRLLN